MEIVHKPGIFLVGPVYCARNAPMSTEKFLAITSNGLYEILEEELKDFGFNTELTPDGVLFETDWEGVYKAHLWSRVATRILLPLKQFTAESQDELYEGVKAIDFSEWVTAERTILVDGSVNQSRFKDQRFVALKAKDAIVDQFREKFDKRPNVERNNPDFRVSVRIVKQTASVAIDLSGETLSKRGYRKEMGIAPVREHLAAGLLRATGWKGETPIVDPMCGSGTFLIEAAMMALDMAPGLFHKGFGFQKLNNFDEALWGRLVDEATEREKESLDFKLFGSDRNGRAIEAAIANANSAGVSDFIEFKKLSVDEVDPQFDASAPEGIVITNPPYGERLGDAENLRHEYKDLSYALKQHFQGWDAYVLSGNPELTKHLGLKADQRWTVLNGQIKCRFLKYSIRKEPKPT